MNSNTLGKELLGFITLVRFSLSPLFCNSSTLLSSTPDAQMWEIVQCKGARPIILGDNSVVLLNKKIYAYVNASNADQGIPQEILPKLPALFVLDLNKLHWSLLLPKLEARDDDDDDDKLLSLIQTGLLTLP